MLLARGIQEPDPLTEDRQPPIHTVLCLDTPLPESRHPSPAYSIDCPGSLPHT